ncbi:hypothetical protein B566_EDAN018952 [Ephemera danica]|nr:hypothetical protein B566_EDAN018952 [Ephemera danica]
MPVLKILRYPDPRLHTVAKPVAEVNDDIRTLADDMLATMYAADGVGLAATQVDVHLQLVVMDTSTERDAPRVLINPTIVWRSDELAQAEEGCLSVPATYDKVTRHARVRCIPNRGPAHPQGLIQRRPCGRRHEFSGAIQVALPGGR